MNLRFAFQFVFSLAVLVLLAACSSGPKVSDVDTAEDIPVYTDDEGVDIVDVDEDGAGTASGVDVGDGLLINPLDDPSSELFVRTIYFDYDSMEVVGEAVETVREHGNYLAANPALAVRLEGHADERGTREYNLALGESRAKAVRQIMLLQGALDTQIEIVSFGEERPAVAGEDEEAYRLNRRVEIVY